MDTMKRDFVNLSSAQVYDRIQEVRAARKQRTTKRNYPHWDELRLEHYESRMNRRVYLRYLHLARAFLRDQRYENVESSVREGNEVVLEYLMAVLRDYGYEPNPSYVERWFHKAA